MILFLIIQLTLPGVINKGDRVFYHDARSCALGGVMMTLEHSQNPSTMGLLDDITIAMSGAVSLVNEKRGLRVYDSYGNNIGISTITNTTFLHALPSASTFIVPFRFVRTGFQFVPVWDYTYTYHREYRDDFYQITRTLDQKYSGRTYAISPMIGLTHSWIHLGIMQCFMYGNREFEENIVYPDGPDSTMTHEYGLDGTTTQCGILLAPGMHLRVSYMYQFSYVLKGDNDIATDSFPEQHRIGFMYQPGVRIPTRFFGEIHYETWDEPLLLYRTGIEHTLLGSYALRYGFCLYPDYTENSVWTTVLTIGFGVKQPGFTIDIGYAYGKRDYTANKFDNLGETNNLSFDESLNHLLLTFTVRL